MQGSLPAMINSVSCSNTPSLITSRVACTLNIWRVGSLSLYIYILYIYMKYIEIYAYFFPPKKMINKNTFSSCCIVGYWSDDHCKLNIELNLPLNHFTKVCIMDIHFKIPTVDDQHATDGHIAALLVKPDMQNHQGMAHLHHKAMAGQPTPTYPPSEIRV